MYSKLSCNAISVGMPRNGIYSLQPHASFVKIVVALTRAVLDAQSAAQRQPGHSRGDPAGRAERPPTPTELSMCTHVQLQAHHRSCSFVNASLKSAHTAALTIRNERAAAVPSCVVYNGFDSHNNE